MGTLGILERADRLGLIDLPVVLSELKKSGFFMSTSLEDLLLRRNRLRHSK
jgi:predicted nucleic acid-binding protein